VLQGSVATGGVFIKACPGIMAMGEGPAMTLVPNFLVTGILAILVAVSVAVWSALFVQKSRGGLILIALAVVLLLVGGGFFPPVLAGVAGILFLRNTPRA